MTARVIVSVHAEQQHTQRCGLKPAHAIALDVEDALDAGRWSRRRPKWLRGDGWEERVTCALYAWPPGKRWAFCLYEKEGAKFVVATVLLRKTAANRRYPKGRDRERDLANARAQEGYQ